MCPDGMVWSVDCDGMVWSVDCDGMVWSVDCDRPHVTFWAGGFSDAGMSSQVEVWRTPEARRGMPKLSMGHPVYVPQGPQFDDLLFLKKHDLKNKNIFRRRKILEMLSKLMELRFIIGRRRDLAGVGCGSMALFVGGTDGKTAYNTVTVWSAHPSAHTPAHASTRRHPVYLFCLDVATTEFLLMCVVCVCARARVCVCVWTPSYI